MLCVGSISEVRRRNPHSAVRSCPMLSHCLVQLFTSRIRPLKLDPAGCGCILSGMIRRLRFNPSHRRGLVVSLLIAVLLPVVILLLAQYRSLAGLEGKTRAAVQEDLRQTLQSFTCRVVNKAEALAAETLGRIDPADVEGESFEIGRASSRERGEDAM